jgi:DNA polymerase-4
VKKKLNEVIGIMWERCEVKQMIGKTVTLKLRFADFSTITRSITHNQTYTKEETEITLMNMLPESDIQKKGVRLLGATMSHFPSEKDFFEGQLNIKFKW